MKTNVVLVTYMNVYIHFSLIKHPDGRKVMLENYYECTTWMDKFYAELT